MLAGLLFGAPVTAGADPKSEPSLERGEDAFETYELNALGLIHIGPRDAGSWAPARGKYRRAMTYEQFYRAVERPDLADDHARRQGLFSLLYFGGWGAILAGGVLFFVGFEDSEPGALSWVGAGVVGGGVGLILFSASVDDVALSEQEATDLALQQNARLRRRLGLRDLPSWSPPKRTRPFMRLSLAPRIAPVAAGFGLVGDF
jgi:hypothetical protein